MSVEPLGSIGGGQSAHPAGMLGTPEARRRGSEDSEGPLPASADNGVGGRTPEEQNARNSDPALAGDSELTPREEALLRKLRKRDAEVRAHEQAHLAAAGGLARGGPSYTYQVGPDGKRYAIGGSVNIDTSPVYGDPEATIAKAQRIRQSALAPADPSAQDRSVAAEASKMESDARRDMIEEQVEESQSRADAGKGDDESQGDSEFVDFAEAGSPDFRQSSLGEPFSARHLNSQGASISAMASKPSEVLASKPSEVLASDPERQTAPQVIGGESPHAVDTYA